MSHDQHIKAVKTPEATPTKLDHPQHKRAKLLAQFKKIQLTTDTIPKRGHPGTAPLSCAQEPLWLMSQLEPDNPVYNVAGALEFNGALNTGALQQSFNEVIRRHEILRSRFCSEQGQVLQRVDGFTPMVLQQLDLTRIPEDQAIHCFQNCADEFIRAPFDLSAALPLRGILVALAPQKQILVLTLHHIVADRWSVNILMEEVASLYYHFGNGAPSELPELSLHYGDFAAWQKQQTGANAAHLSYWQQKLQNLNPYLALPFDRPRPAMPSYKGDLYRFELSPALTEAVKQLAKQQNVSLFMFMASALNSLLHRYSGSQDIAIGYTAAGRQQTQTAKLIGFFVNTLVLRTHIEGEEPFAEVLKRIREQTLDDQDHQEVSYGQLMEAVSNTQRTPLFQVMLTVQNAPAVEFQLPGLTVKPVTLEKSVSQFDLTFLVEDQNGQFQIAVEYSTDLFDAATLTRLAGHFTNLLDGIVKQPDMPLSRLPLLSPDEWQETVIDWNLPQCRLVKDSRPPLFQRGGAIISTSGHRNKNGALKFGSGLTKQHWNQSCPQQSLNLPESAVPEWIAGQALATPNNTAVVFASTKISYRELNAQANRLAHHLQSLDVGPETRIGVSAERSIELIIALLAVLKAGAAYVPLDPAYPQERLDFIIKDASIDILLTQPALYDQFLDSGCTLVDIEDCYADYSSEALAFAASPNNTAYIIYTSGSTGQPKGVMVSHRNLRHSTLARFDYYQGSPKCFLLLSSFGFDSSVAGIFWTLSRGGCLCLPQQDAINNPAALAALIAQHHVSHLLALPSFYAAILSHSELASLRPLSAVIVAGEACASEVANEHHRKLPGIKFYNEYGPTEATVWSSVYESHGTETLPVLPIGRAINNVQIYILDKHLQPVPIGIAGELCIGGQGITQGYVRRPDLTAEKFIPNPFASHGSRLYKTGDLARFLADGNIEFLGRLDHQVKIRGFRIELGEIEARLVNFPNIQEAVVIAREDKPGEKRLVAYLQAPHAIDLHALRAHLATALPDYMLPSAFVTLDTFPLNPNGKLDRHALPAPDLTAVATQDYDAPQTSAETALAGCWQALLGIERVGRNDHFFELGGHSLMAIALVEQLQQRGYTADVINVFTLPVLAELAATLEHSTQAAESNIPPNLIPDGCLALTPDLLPLVKLTQNEIDSISACVPGGAANIQDIYPLSALQEGILFHHRLDESHDAYLKRSVLSFDSRAQLDSFLDALQTVINRHDILRTAVHWQGLSQAVQVVQRKALLPIVTLDLSVTDEALPGLLQQTGLSHTQLDLQRAPLFAAFIAADSNSGNWLLALINHHLIDDNYTLQLILSEIKLIQQGQADKLLPPLPYRNFIAQKSRASLDQHESYFREQLADISEPTAPFGILDIQGDGLNVTEAKLTLSAEVSERIYDSARQHGISTAVLFHAAWARVLSQLCGQDNVVFGTVLSGRLQASGGAAQALGVFINTLPIRISLGTRSVQEVVNNSFHGLAALLEHEHASLALAQRCSSVPTPLPLFTSLLNYRHSHLLAGSTESLFAGGSIKVLRTEERTNYPITLSVDDLGHGFSFSAQCVDGIDPERITAYLATAITGLVEALSQAPQTPVSGLSLLSAQERQQVLVGFNAAVQPFPEHLCIQQLFEQQVEKNPEAIALVYEDRSLSYDELNRKANRLAHRLIALGVHPDDRVALCVGRSLDMVIGVIGILKAGGAYVPLDPSYPEERLLFMLADAAPVALVTQADLQAQLPKPDQTVPVVVIDAPAYQGLGGQRLEINPQPSALGLTSQHLAYIIYTSGSTGQPKGTLVNHRNVVRLFSATETQFGFNAGDVWTLFHSYAFDFSVWEIWGALLYGGRLVVVPYETSRHPDAFYQLLCCENVTVLNQTPSAFRQLCPAHAQNPKAHKLRVLMFGGEALDANTLDSWFAHNGPECAQPALYNGYGPTETTVFATFYPCHPNHQGVYPIGYPIANTQMYILDAHLQPVPIGVMGEIYIGGAGVTRGYLNRPELTAGRFIANPFALLLPLEKPVLSMPKWGGRGEFNSLADCLENPPYPPFSKGGCETPGSTLDGGQVIPNQASRLYKTGDLGRWLPDGSIDYLGRNDFQVKIRGFRIELGEIEAQLSRCDGVREAVVVVREDVPGDKRLVAYLVAEAGHEMSAASLRSQLSATLADYMLPGAFVMLDKFPLTTNGKLDRKALPAPDGSAVSSRAYEAPLQGTETVIAELWKELLHLDKVGRYDGFFELGGHSLLAVQLVARVRQTLGVELALRELFTYPVLAGLAQAVNKAQLTQLPPIVPADRSQPLPLSWAQQRLWFLSQFDADASLAYHIPAGLRLLGQLNKPALKASLDRIVARHEVLRTSFASIDGEARQVIAATGSGFALLEHDLRGLTSEAEAQTLALIYEAEAEQAFDLTTGPLIRGRLLSVANDEHLLLITQHHIISDGWSIGRMVKEFTALYTAFSQGQADPLPLLTIQYADYAVWQRQWLQGAVLQAQIEFWKSQLAGAPELLDMPTDFPRPVQQSYRGASVNFTLSKALTAQLKQFSQDHNATLFMSLLTAWSVLMARLSGQNDLVIGTPVANRSHADLENLIGFFVNTLALRVRLDDEPSTAGLLEQIKATTLAAYAHQDLPFEQLVEALNPTRSMSHSPVFQVMLALNNTPAEALNLPGLTVSPLELEQATTQFDLSLVINDLGGELAATLHYATDLFTEQTITRMAGHFQTLLTAMLADEQQAVSRLPLLTTDETRQVLVGFNTTKTCFAQPLCIHQLFEQHALQTPDAVALVFEDQSLSYGQLNRQANHLAHRLIDLGIRPHDRVAVCAGRSLETVIGLLGILKAGGAYVPLDPNYPVDRLTYMLGDCAPVALLTRQAVLAESALFRKNLQVPVMLLDVQDDADGFEHNPNPTDLGLSSEHLAYVIYTSGSTGQPKGVMVHHQGLCNLALAQTELLGVNPNSRVLQFASFSFDASIWEIVTALCHGARLCLASQEALLPGAALAQTILDEGITHLLLPSAVLAILPDSLPAKGLTLVVGGDVCPPDLAKKWSKKLKLINAYGPTEATVFVTAYPCSTGFSASVPIGYPIANTQMYILDAHLQPVPVGVTGELYIGGAGVAKGYLNRPELTAKRFIDNPFLMPPPLENGGCEFSDSSLDGGQVIPNQASCLYKTGDLGRWLPDGCIEYLGRNDFQVKIRGFRIELGEIEAQLAHCSGVREAVVVAREDFQGDKRLVAYLTAEPRHTLLAADLRSQLSNTLPDYMLPSAFVVLECLPLTQNGKLDRKALPAPDSFAVVTHAYEAPIGATENLIAGIWQALLHLDSIGRHDNFFELGGHSLLIVTLIDRLQQQGLNATVRTVFTTPVLAEMAAAIDNQNSTEVTCNVPPNLIPEHCTAVTPELLPLVTLTQAEIDGLVEAVPEGVTNIEDIYPLAPLQEGILFHHLLESQGDAYLLRTVLNFDSKARLDSFLSALQTVIDRHAILRTAIHWQGLPQPVQAVQRYAALPVIELELTGDIQETALEQLLRQTDPRHTRLNLQQAPLFAAYLMFDAKANEWLLSLLNHHLVCEHVTLSFIIDEIQMIVRGQSACLPAPLPYRNFIAQALSISPAEHEAYFKSRLGDIDEPTAPFGILDVQGDGSRISEATLPLSTDLAQNIRNSAKQHGVTAAVMFHLAWAKVLAQCSGRDDVVFGTVLMGRLQGSTDAGRVLGLFINTLPIRISLAGHSVRQLVEETQRNLSGLLEHEQASLALAQRCSAVEAPLPLFTTLLNYRHSSTQANQAFEEDGTTLIAEGIKVHPGEERTNYPVTLSVDDLGQGFSLTAQCVSDIQPERMAAYLETALSALVEALNQNPETRFTDLTSLPAAEHQRVVHDFNANAAAFPAHLCIHELFEQQVLRNPDAIALVYENQRLTYDGLNRKANQLAHRLIALGIRPDDKVAICVGRSLEMVIGLLGVLKAGAAYVPLDPSYPVERLAFLLDDCAPVALLTQKALLAGTTVSAEKLQLPVLLIDALDAQTGLDTNPSPKGLSSESLAYIIYTSGSTGQPKGTLVNHRNVVRLFTATEAQFGFNAGDVWTLFHSYAFDFSVWELWGALAYGGRLVVVPYATSRSPEEFYQLVCREQVTVLNQTPSAFRQLAPAHAINPSAHQLRVLILGGETLEASALDTWLANNGKHCAQPCIYNGYGPTETTVFATFHHCQPGQGGIIPIGKPIANTQVYILDAWQQPVPVGVAGELYIGGLGVAGGYLNQPQLTAERFIDQRFMSDRPERLYKTGDLGRWLDDGSIEYLGRNDFQVKLRGFRIELGEIEAQLSRCTGVRDAVVVAREDVPGDKRLVAYLTAEPGHELVAADLRSQLSVTLADYMLPSAFVTVDTFPLTTNGKLDRKALPAPDGGAVVTRPFEAPQGETETLLASIWKELLSVAQVGRHDHFFDLGGHSLLAVQMVVRIRNHLQIETPLTAVFENPTLAGLAAHLVDLQLALYSEHDIARLEAELNNLSEAELHALLAEEPIE